MEQVQLRLPPTKVLKQLHLGFVQIFLNASIACIIYTRRLIKRQSRCFLSRNVSQLTLFESPQCLESVSEIHERFCSVEWEPRSDEIESQEFKVMQRGVHQCADDILDMLSSGIMDGIQKDYLSAMKLFIIGRGSRNSSPTIVETYTFVFQSTAESAPSVKLVETNQNFSVHDLQKSFKKGVNTLLRSIRDLPALPRHGRKIGASLLFRKSCPILYQPDGFAASTDNQTTLWNNRCDILRATQFNTGSITINICVEQHEGQLDADYRFSTYLNGLQHTSSRDPVLPPTMEHVKSSSKRKRSIADVGGQNIGSHTHRPTAHLSGIWEPVATVEESLDVADEFIAEKQHKISDSKAVVQFSSQSTNQIPSSDIDGEAFR